MTEQEKFQDVQSEVDRITRIHQQASVKHDDWRILKRALRRVFGKPSAELMHRFIEWSFNQPDKTEHEAEPLNDGLRHDPRGQNRMFAKRYNAGCAISAASQA